MKKVVSFILGLIVCAPLAAQTPARKQPTTHADMAVQKECYQQAHTYVSDANKNSVPDPYFSFTQSHYDPVSKICYVEYQHFEMSGSGMLWIINVADAFEGKIVAEFVESNVKQSDGTYQELPPTICQVNGKACNEQAAFNGLLWKLIPAFEPVDSKVVKRKL